MTAESGESRSGSRSGKRGRGVQKRHTFFTDEQKGRLVALAELEGAEQAAVAFDCHPDTVREWVRRACRDAGLRALADERKNELQTEWRDVAVRFLRKGIAKLEALVDQAGPGQIREVAGAIKIVGELQTANRVLSDGEQPRVNRQGSQAAATTRADARASGGTGSGAGSNPALPPPAPTGGNPVH